MDEHPLCDDIIRAVDRLKAAQGSKNDVVNNVENLDNPLPRIITPEWHYSQSNRILDDVDIDWDSLERSDLIKKTATVLPIDFDNLRREEFERSFCSWYQPYHYLPRTKWGIHIRYDSLKRVAANFHQSFPSLKDSNIGSVKAAVLYLFIHQLFHHITENAASLIEIITGKLAIYRRYYSNVYIKAFNSCECLEESLANRFLIAWTDACHIEREYLKKELLGQADGYKDFINYMESNFLQGKRRLISQVKNGSLNIPYDEPLEKLLDSSNLTDYTQRFGVPIWLHHRPRPLYCKSVKK